MAGHIELKTGQGTRRFEVLDKLGQGYWAETRRVRDIATGGEYAAKLQHPVHASHPDGFDHEAAVGQSVSDSHVCTVLGTGQGDGRRALLMELVPGERLKNKLPLPPEQAIGVMREALSGLARMHAQGWVHGDVNWSNIMVNPSGPAKLIDFGSSKRATPAGVAEDLSRAGKVLTASVLGVRGELLKTVFAETTQELPERVTTSDGRIVELRAVAARAIAGGYASPDAMLADLAGIKDNASLFHGYAVASNDIGRGTVGKVRLAVKPDGTTVAMKRMSNLGAAAREAEAMRRFANAATRHVCHLHQSFVDGDRAYLVMDAGGPRLRELVEARGGRLEQREAVTITLAVLDGLEAMHVAGVLHRDVHVDNVVVHPDDLGSTMVIDFGQAAIQEEAGAWRVHNGGGNAPIMPPENVSQGISTPTPASDVFEAAALCARIMLGEPPFSRRGTEPPYFSPAWSDYWRAIHRRGPDLEGIADAGLRAVLTKAMAFEPAARYPTAAAMREALRPYLNESSRATPAPPSAPREGVLFKNRGEHAIYVVVGGAKLHVPDPITFAAMGYRWIDVVEIQRGAAAAISDVPRDGTLVKEHGSNAVYVLQNGALLHVPDPNSFTAAGFSWADVKTVPPRSLSHLAAGKWADYQR